LLRSALGDRVAKDQGKPLIQHRYPRFDFLYKKKKKKMCNFPEATFIRLEYPLLATKKTDKPAREENGGVAADCSTQLGTGT